MFQFKFSFYFKSVLFLLCFASKSEFSIAQKYVDQVIPNTEKKKVEKARKLYNEYKIYDGEKILKDLVKEHPGETYYLEALVQMQRQVLARIELSSEELKELNPEVEKDSLDNDASDEVVNYLDGTIVPKETEKKFDSGLDTRDRITRKDRRQLERQKEKEAMEQDATVTIDSSILKTPIDEFGTSSDIEKENKKINKSLQKRLKQLQELAQIPYEPYKNDLIQNCRTATRVLEHSDSASSYLREFLVDTLNPDREASEEAMNFYEDGLAELYSSNPSQAAKLFEKAIEKYPYYYVATLRLADAYYLMNKDTSAIRLYTEATKLQPVRPEAWEKLSMAYYQRGKYTDAAASIIQAIIIYPQQHYFHLLKTFVKKTGKDFNTQWIQRDVFPITTAHVYEEIVVDDKSPWWHYQAAKQDVYSYFDTAGIVRPNEKTNERYLEVYGWKKMLNNSSRKNFQFARAMEQIGYLDCYVLVTLFHQDLYGQFIDFSSRNNDKIKNYFYMLINWDDKKFDKLRQKVAVPEKAKTEEKKKAK